MGSLYINKNFSIFKFFGTEYFGAESLLLMPLNILFTKSLT